MAELGTVEAIGTAVVAGAGLVAIPGVDVSAVVGGFAGALFFVIFAADKSFKASLGYMLSSWIFGYFAAGQVTALGWPITPPLVALTGAALFVVLFTGLLEWFRSGKAPFWFKFVPWLKGVKDV